MITKSALHLLQAMMDVASGQLPSYDTLSAMTGIAKGRLHEHFRALADSGLIAIVRDAFGYIKSATILAAGFLALGLSVPAHLIELAGWDRHARRRPARRAVIRQLAEAASDTRHYPSMKAWEHDWYGGLTPEELWMTRQMEKLASQA